MHANMETLHEIQIAHCFPLADATKELCSKGMLVREKDFSSLIAYFDQTKSILASRSYSRKLHLKFKIDFNL